MFDSREQRMEPEPLRERAHELTATRERNVASSERVSERQVSYPYSRQRFRIGFNAHVDAKPWVGEAQIRVRQNEPEVSQLLRRAAKVEIDHSAVRRQFSRVDRTSHPPHEQPRVWRLLEDGTSQPTLTPNPN